MINNSTYKFKVSLSVDAYVDKKISGAMIGSTKSEENRITRKAYGFSSNKGVGYKEVELTSSELLDNMINGHVMCNLFNPTQTRQDGTFGSSEKKDDNFRGSFVVGVDIDETSYPTAEEFISKLSLKPTIYYTSYSNLQTGKGARFRMLYVFDTMISGQYFFRYIAWNINKYTEEDTQETIKDDCNLRCSQYYNGTNLNTPGLNVSYGITNNIYSFSDFGCDEEGYREFLRNNCYYKSFDSKRTAAINGIILGVNATISEEVLDTTDSVCSQELINEMKKNDYDTFMKYNRHKFTYFWRPVVEGDFTIVDEDYFQLFYNVDRVEDGNCRRKKLFERMCLRRVINPSVTADELLFNAYEDVARFFVIDDDLTVDCLVKNVDLAMRKDIEIIKKEYSNSISFLKSQAPKHKVIFKKSEGKNSMTLVSEALTSVVSENYDENLSVKENLEKINKIIPVSERFLYDWLKKNNKKTDNKKLTDEELIKIIDNTLSIRKNVELVKQKGYKVSKDRISKLLKPTTIDIIEEEPEEVIEEIEEVIEEPKEEINTGIWREPIKFNLNPEKYKIPEPTREDKEIVNNGFVNYRVKWI